MAKSTNNFILIYSMSLYRVESRYKNAYKYEGVALRRKLEISLKEWTRYVEELKRAKAAGYDHRGDAPEEMVVMEEREYAKLIKGKGEWKENLLGNGKKIWVAFDTPACCDPSTETYHCM
jgi:hypothetical protein